MKLLEKLTDEEVDEMILKTEIDDTQCSEQIVDVPVPDRRQNRGNCHSIPQERIPERVVVQSVNMSGHTHKVVEKIVNDSQSPAASCDPAVNQ